ncbi:E3 ubiquitin-protein ligase TRIM33 [Acyrthosiphon pisum]|uniref:E3 ubiquitin-protein ligase TRIM33 n=1 Tax=Acyrthosiphon pisum TaxID=7029 RepID=A0A8R2B7M3_ACYPI|nr:E3 ubiquitin-protein ligase TRIM33 [Acyrthosiphon pisum]|eukprot:XP_008185139.2 PREDICTED: E3 ubiquitin-protein ligase TRIM33-like [Acyrthosiphon pisum]
MNSDIASNENVDLWSMGKCIFCKGKIEEDSKILKCLHIICKDCTKRENTDSGIGCKCKIVTKGELIDYSTMAPNQTQVKICCEKNCQVIAKKICMHCKNVYCKPCSKTHSIKNEDHNPAFMMTYPLKKEFVPCPKCMEKSVEVFCIKCSIMLCPLCHLNFHQQHDFKLLSNMAVETKAELQTLLTDISKENNHLNFIMQMSNENITKLKSEKKKIKDKIDERIKMIHEEADKRGLELKKLLETNFSNAVNNINMNNMIINDFKKENDYYYSLTSSVINRDKIVEYIKLSKIIKDQMVIAKRHTQDMPKEATKCKAELIYNDEQSVNKIIESIQGMGNIISSNIFSLSEFKTTVDSNNVLQTLENNRSPILRSGPVMILPGMVKLEKDNCKMITDEDSDSSDFEPMVNCSCCNQFSEELLIHCTSCDRFYHNHCHIPPLAKELKSNDPSLKFWKCTLCHDILKHASNLREKNMTGHIDSSGRKIIERILLELYCQNEDSEHYRECVDGKVYPEYYDQISNPISLNNIKQRLEFDASYTSLVGILKDMKKVMTNGKTYYSSSSHPYYKSAYELEISLDRMISLWLPTLDRAYLE